VRAAPSSSSKARWRALDRLTLLSADSEPKVAALFAQAELNRSYCGQRNPIPATTPKYHRLWKALTNRTEARRAGRSTASARASRLPNPIR